MSRRAEKIRSSQTVRQLHQPGIVRLEGNTRHFTQKPTRRKNKKGKTQNTTYEFI